MQSSRPHICGEHRKAVYDVVVLGGGPSGAAAAMELSRAGLSVALLERTHYEGSRVGETLPGHVIRPLARLGLWEAFLKEGHESSASILAIWSGGGPHENDYLFSAYGGGWHLDRTRFDIMLARAAEAAGVSVHRGARLEACDRGEGQIWNVGARVDGISLSLAATWVVDATGRSSWLGRRQGFRKRVCDQLICLVKFGEIAARGDSSTLIEASQDGWWYGARLPDGSAVVAYFTDSDLIPRRGHQLRAFWCDRLADTRLVSTLVRGIQDRRPVRVVTAATTKLDRAAGEGWLAVGDAAQSYDPLSGQGITRALGMGIAAAEAIAARRAGDLTAIHRFADHADIEFERYEMNRMAVYARETRWPRSVFWKRRHPR